MKRKAFPRLLFSFLALLCAAVFLQPTTACAFSPPAPPDRSSPGATLRSFIFNMNAGMRILEEVQDIWSESPFFFRQSPEAVRKGRIALLHFERAKQCLDFSGVPAVIRDETGWEAMLLLNEILARTGIPPADRIPDARGVVVPGRPPVPRWTVPRTEIQLHRIADGVDEGRWLVSPESVARLKGDYLKVKDIPYLPGATMEGAYEEYRVAPGRLWGPWTTLLPEWSKFLLFGQTLWQWIGLALSLLIFLGAQTGVWRLVRRLAKGRSALAVRALKMLPPLLLSFAAAWQIAFVDHYINLTGAICVFLVNLLTVLRWLGWSWSVFRLGDLLAELIILGPMQPRRELSPRIDPESIDASVVRTVSSLITILAVLGILTHGAAELGFSLATILTGFGVAGLALSLAAQPTIENIIGGLTLFADRPVKVGEFCRFGGTMGTVLGIGLRCTRIEALNHTIISIPNAEFSRMQIVNVSRRADSLMEKRIGLRYETSEDQLRWILASVRELLHAHPMVCAAPPPLARFENFGESSLEVLVFAYLKTKHRAELMAIEEDILFHVGKIVERAGSSFALPSTTAYIAADAGLDDEKGAEAEKAVREWREKDEYPFPETPLERIAAIRGSVEYPPRGQVSEP